MRAPFGRRMRKTRSATIHLLFAVAAAGIPTLAAAQSWAVVRSGTGDATEAERTARTQLIDALTGSGVAMRVDAEAAARVEDYHSVEPTAVESDRIEELRAAVTALEEHAALRHRDAARQEAERIRVLSEGLSSALAEQSEVADRLFAACVAEAWLHIQLREREEARQGLQQCRELHPDVEINPLTVAPPVVDMLREIDTELSRRPTFALTLAGVPTGCELRMDGRRRATAPEPIRGIVPGEHRIEVVCEGMRRRRIHRVIVGAEDRTVSLEPRFDDVLLTRPAVRGDSPEVRLDYPSERDETRQRIADAVTLGGLLEVSDVILVTRDVRGLRFDRASVASRAVTATVIVDATAFTGAVVLRAAAALLENRSLDLSGPEAVAIRPWPASGDASAEGGGEAAAAGSDDGSLPAGVTLGVVGLGTLGGAWGMYAVAQGASEAMIASDPRNSDWRANRDLRESTIAAGYGLSIGGSVLVTASLPLWLPQTPGEVPWWSVVIGGLGACLFIPAGYAWSLDDRYDMSIHAFDTELYGALFVSMAVPMMAIPIVYLIRLVTDPAMSATVSAEVTPDRTVVSLSGHF